MFKIYCTKNDIVYSYAIGKVIMRPSEHLKLILKSNKIDINDFWNKVCKKLSFNQKHCIDNIYLANIINDILNKMIKENNKTLEIE